MSIGASPSEPLYDRIYRRLERARWSLAEIPFDTVDRKKVSDEVVEFVRVNCLLEMSSLDATRMFLRDFRGDHDFCQFMSIWYFEEMRHYLVLREYLKLFGREPGDEELEAVESELKPAPWPGTLAMHWCGELRLGLWYLRWAEEFAEPVLASIFRRIGEDELRHAQCYEDFMSRALKEDAGLLLPFINTAKWMLFNPGGDKHPTTYAAGSVDDLSVSDRIEGYGTLLKKLRDTVSERDSEQLERRVLTSLSRWSGQPMRSRADVVRFSRSLAPRVG